MVATALLVGLLLLATYTDVRWRKIYNWTTYPGALIALGCSAVATWRGGDANNELYGFISFSDSVAGLLACGAVMLVCYVFFPGGVGGGDVKLIAMIGAFLGVGAGLEAMLWTFVFGGCAALILLIWRVGAATLLVRAAKNLIRFLRGGPAAFYAAKSRTPQSAELFLSPSALAAVIVVHFRLLQWW